MEKTPSRTPGSIEGFRKITYRVRGIPHGLDIEGVRTLLRASLEVETLSLDSLAASSSRKQEQVATFRHFERSAKLDGERTEWLVPAVSLKGPNKKQLLVDTHFEGFTPLHDPVGSSEDAFDCVAISGLGSHAFGSWKDRHSPYMWLRDALPQYLPNARVLIYGYDSKLVGSHSFQNLSDVGSRFRASLKVALGSIPRERPLIFVAHSLGGLVLKQAMVQMSSGDAADSRNFKATFGILFFGVPNQGMDISSLLAMVHGQPNLHFLSTLSKDGGLLHGLIERFRTIFNFQDSKIYSFYETDMSPTAQEGEPAKWSMNGKPAVLVDRHSARSGRSWEGDHFHIPISRNHSEMVKFSEYSEDCSIVCDILRQFGEEARTVINRRWWFWEKEFATKISFSGNPVFKMLFSDDSTLSPSKSETIGSGALHSGAPLSSFNGADTESDRRPWMSSTSESQSHGSTIGDITRRGGAATSNKPLEVPTRDQRSVNAFPIISDGSSHNRPPVKKSSQQANIIFNKTIEGSRRNLEVYERVGVLFLTWQTGTQCGLPDVDTLRDLLRTQFNFETREFKIPLRKWQASFAKAVADFLYAYDSPERLAIIYYGGHGYQKNETGLVELTGKVRENVVVEGMLEDLRTVLRLPRSDLLIIIDDCNTTGSFDASRRREHLIGKQRIEILTSGAAVVEENGAGSPGGFTRCLNTSLSSLLTANPHGFSSSTLYVEICNAALNIKPQLFDLSSGHHDKIVLCPPRPSRKPPEAKRKGELVLNVSLRLAEEHIEASMMNDIASHLRFLPHVEEIRFQNLSAPSEAIEDFMQFLVRAQKIRPLMRKLQARRQSPRQSLLGLERDSSKNLVYDWSRSEREHPALEQ